MNDEAIIEFGSRMWELKAVIHATPFSIFIHDSSYHIQPHSMIFSGAPCAREVRASEAP